MTYLDSAATTKPCAETVEAVTEAMRGSFGNASSLHGMGIRSEKIIAAAKKTLARKARGRRHNIHLRRHGEQQHRHQRRGGYLPPHR